MSLLSSSLLWILDSLRLSGTSRHYPAIKWFIGDQGQRSLFLSYSRIRYKKKRDLTERDR
jgi:hypothetical protein